MEAINLKKEITEKEEQIQLIDKDYRAITMRMYLVDKANGEWEKLHRERGLLGKQRQITVSQLVSLKITLKKLEEEQ